MLDSRRRRSEVTGGFRLAGRRPWAGFQLHANFLGQIVNGKGAGFVQRNGRGQGKRLNPS